MLRVTIPLGAGVTGSYVAELSADRLEEQFGCQPGRPLRLSLDGRSAVEINPSVYVAEAGDTLETHLPGRRPHEQQIEEDSLVIETMLPASGRLAMLARQLSGRSIACRLDFAEGASTWRTCTTSGRLFGASTFRTTFAGVDGIELSEEGQGEEATLTVI